MKAILKFTQEGKRKQETPHDRKELIEALLEFDLVGEEQELLDAVNGWRWRDLAQDFDERLRMLIKHVNGKGHLEEARDLFRELRAERRLNLWD